MVINVDEQDVILSNSKTYEQIDEYIASLSQFYKVSKLELNKQELNIIELLNQDKSIQIIPHEKEKRFKKACYTILKIA